jgi:AcrR family transcriptional regulator
MSEENSGSSRSTRAAGRKSRFAPPVQRRSEQTLARMVEATREALATARFDELPLAEITARAGVTVGAFYQRFPSKAAFMEYLAQDTYREIREASATLFVPPEPGRERSVGEHLGIFVSGMAAIYREHRGVMRELVQRSRSNRRRQRARMDMTREVVARAVDWILSQGGAVDHPDPRRALSIALLFTSSALRDVILFDESWAGGDEEAGTSLLVDELTRAARAYLGLPDEG